MKIIRLVAGIALGALIAGTTVTAQESKEGKKGDRPEGKGPPTVEKQLEHMTKELSLTDEQKPKVKAVIEANRKKMEELYSQAGGDREKMRELRGKRKELSDEQDKKLKEILKSEQYEKWEKMRDKMREDARKGRKGGAGAEGEKKKD